MKNYISLISGGFAQMDAPFALHQADKIQAKKYRDAVNEANLGWLDVEEHLLAYAEKRGWNNEKRKEETKRVKKFMKM